MLNKLLSMKICKMVTLFSLFSLVLGQSAPLAWAIDVNSSLLGENKTELSVIEVTDKFTAPADDDSRTLMLDPTAKHLSGGSPLTAVVEETQNNEGSMEESHVTEKSSETSREIGTARSDLQGVVQVHFVYDLSSGVLTDVEVDRNGSVMGVLNLAKDKIDALDLGASPLELTKIEQAGNILRTATAQVEDILKTAWTNSTDVISQTNLSSFSDLVNHRVYEMGQQVRTARNAEVISIPSADSEHVIHVAMKDLREVLSQALENALGGAIYIEGPAASEYDRLFAGIDAVDIQGLLSWGELRKLETIGGEYFLPAYFRPALPDGSVFAYQEPGTSADYALAETWKLVIQLVKKYEPAIVITNSDVLVYTIDSEKFRQVITTGYIAKTRGEQVRESLVNLIRSRQFQTAGSPFFDPDFDLDNDGRIMGSDVILMRDVTILKAEIWKVVNEKIMHAVSSRQFQSAGDSNYIPELDVDQDGHILGSDVILIRDAIGQDIRNQEEEIAEQRQVLLDKVDVAIQGATAQIRLLEERVKAIDAANLERIAAFKLEVESNKMTTEALVNEMRQAAENKDLNEELRMKAGNSRIRGRAATNERVRLLVGNSKIKRKNQKSTRTQTKKYRYFI